MRLTRRRFLKSSLAAAATITVAGTKSSGKVLGANDTVRIAVAGLNGRGGSHVGAFGAMKNVEVVALVDPDTRTYKGRIGQLAKLGRAEPACRTCARPSKTRRSTRSRSRLRTTGTHS